MEIIRKKNPTAPKILIYGGAGVGKSTLASQMPDPIFLDLEGGLNYMDVARTPLIKDDETLYSTLLELANAKTPEFKTIVIDSVDWLVRKLSEKIAGVGYDDKGQKVQGFVALDKTLDKNLMDANGGFGKAKEELENHVRSKLLPMLAALNQRGYGIVLIAHQYSTDMLDDDGATIEKVQPKIDPPTIGRKPIAQPAIIEWVDNVFYLKKVNGDRILQVDGDNYAVAKNRIGLQGEYNLKDTTLPEILNSTEKEGE